MVKIPFSLSQMWQGTWKPQKHETAQKCGKLGSGSSLKAVWRRECLSEWGGVCGGGDWRWVGVRVGEERGPGVRWWRASYTRPRCQGLSCHWRMFTAGWCGRISMVEKPLWPQCEGWIGRRTSVEVAAVIPWFVAPSLQSSRPASSNLSLLHLHIAFTSVYLTQISLYFILVRILIIAFRAQDNLPI